MARTVAGDSAQLEVAGLQHRDSGTEMVIADRFADVELIDLYTMYFVSFHRHDSALPHDGTWVLVISQADELRMS